MTISVSCSVTFGANIFVDATSNFNSTGIFVTGVTQFQITATGTAELARNDGSYQTDPNGIITAAPPLGSGADAFFTNNASPAGVHPAVGSSKSIVTGGQLSGAPFGALVAGFSTTSTPASLSNFPSGFQLVASNGTIISPVSGGFLFLSVNDINSTSDNGQGFNASISEVPEPNPNAFVLGGLALIVLLRPWASRRK